MDDPWGSPWADESTHPLPKVDKLGSKRPVTPGKALGSNKDNKSPWDDDDGFGEWATLPATDEPQSNVQDGPEEAETAEWVSSANEEATQEKDHIRPDSSAWFTRGIQPSNGGDVHLKISQVTGGALSLDPWAQEAVQADEKVRYPGITKTNTGVKSPSSDSNGGDVRGGLIAVDYENELGTAIVSELHQPLPSHGVEEASTRKSSSNLGEDGHTLVSDNCTTDLKPGQVIQGELSASRPSSSPSDQSHRDEVSTESLRTSFEDEEKRPKLERERSSKVKKMVRLFDDLAVDETGIELPGHAEAFGVSADHFDTPIATQSEDDFGDFEEGISYVTVKAGSTEKALTERQDYSLNKAEAPSASALPATTEEPGVSSSDPSLSSHDLVKFELDLSLISLVVGLPPDEDFGHADSKQTPETDSVIQDSFSSTDERKIWYRISRYGTMRKHNAGDEDTHVRINWKNSEVRADTLKIVERWIEEDRIGGGVILGGGSRLGSMFGWGQKNAAPISVAAALASRPGKVVIHTDQTVLAAPIGILDASPVPGSGSNRKSLEQISSSRNSFQSPSSATAPQFSWSTGTPVSAAAAATLPVLSLPVSLNSRRQLLNNLPTSPKATKESSMRRPSASEAALANSRSCSDQPPKLAIINGTTLGKLSINDEASETPANVVLSEMDDDWGAMISSSGFSNPLSVNLVVEGQTTSGITGLLSPDLANISPSMGSDCASDRRFDDRMMAPISDGSIFIPIGVEDHVSRKQTTSSTALKVDVWATADLSFFDDPAPQRLTPAPPPIHKMSISPSVSVKKSQGILKEGMQQDRIVKSIVENLPDLSYMLRR